LLFEIKCETFDGTCLDMIAHYQRLSFYQYLEELYKIEEVLEKFCKYGSLKENRIPFQRACMAGGENLLQYVIGQLVRSYQRKPLWEFLDKLLHHSDWFGNTVLIDLICFEKVNCLSKIYSILDQLPQLLHVKDFRKRCDEDNSIAAMMDYYQKKDAKDALWNIAFVTKMKLYGRIINSIAEPKILYLYW